MFENPPRPENKKNEPAFTYAIGEKARELNQPVSGPSVEVLVSSDMTAKFHEIHIGDTVTYKNPEGNVFSEYVVLGKDETTMGIKIGPKNQAAKAFQYSITASLESILDFYKAKE